MFSLTARIEVMTDTTYTSEKQTMVDEQVERFMAAFSDLRKVMGSGFKHAPQHGFSTTQFMVMGFVESARDGEPYTISSIAGKLGIDSATVVRTVDSLEKRGLVERRRDKQDRRQVFVELTDAGRTVRRELQRRFTRHIQAIFVAMSAEGRASFLDGLEEFVRVGLEKFVQAGQGSHVEREQEPEKHLSYS
jgi:DNA-binding MarR family transcriptional regulator